MQLCAALRIRSDPGFFDRLTKILPLPEGAPIHCCDFAYVRVLAAGRDELHRDRITGKGMRQIDVGDGADPVRESAGGVVQHQFIGLKVAGSPTALGCGRIVDGMAQLNL